MSKQHPLADELAHLARGTGRDLHTLQVKLTYIGPQLKHVPTVVFTTFYHLARMDWFVVQRTEGVSYGNDENDVWNFTTSPEEIAHVVEMLSAWLGQRSSPDGEPPHLSLALVLKESRLGDIGCELICGVEASASLRYAIWEALDERNGTGRRVLNLQSELIG